MNNHCGIVMAGGNGTRLWPLTRTVNKHFLPIYDKPMIYYSLSTLMIAGIRRIAIVSRKVDTESFKLLFGDGSNLGIELEYLKQDSARGVPDGYLVAADFIGKDSVTMILGDNIFIGQGLGQTLQSALNIQGAHIFAFPVTNPNEYGVVNIDPVSNQILSLQEKPTKTNSNLAIPGLYFTGNDVVDFARDLKPSNRGELEITDILNRYHSQSRLSVTSFRRGIGWMDAGSIESLYAANELVEVLQKRQGQRFCCPEEIAWRNGWISDSELIENSRGYLETTYGKYLKELVQ